MSDIIGEVTQQLEAGPFWRRYVQTVRPSFHIVILREPYLSLILVGKKTIESRFRKFRSAPFGKVKSEDVLLLKQSGGKIVAVALALVVRDVLLDEAGWREVRAHEQELCVDTAFWQQVAGAKYATLIWLTQVRELATPVEYLQAGRAGWIVLA